MKLLSHSNGIHKLEKDKVSKRKILEKCIIFLIALLIFGFTIQMITNVVDNTRLKSRFKYVRVDGKKMEYRFKPGGDYTVVFDGAIGANMYEWNQVCESLEEEKKVSTFIYNRRGYGFNDSGDIRTPEEQAEDLKLLLKKAGAPEPYILVGEEYGSIVTTNFISLYPASVAGVVLVNPICEEKINTSEFKSNIKFDYYRSKFEVVGTNFSLTSLLSKMGLTMENKSFMEHITESELDEFNSFKNKKHYKEAVSNELKNLYTYSSTSQVDGLLNNKPLYLITDNEEDPIKKIGNQAFTIVYKEEIEGSPLSLFDSNTIFNGVNSVLKDAKKLAKKP
jgi:predicted esterase